MSSENLGSPIVFILDPVSKEMVETGTEGVLLPLLLLMVTPITENCPAPVKLLRLLS